MAVQKEFQTAVLMVGSLVGCSVANWVAWKAARMVALRVDSLALLRAASMAARTVVH